MHRTRFGGGALATTQKTRGKQHGAAASRRESLEDVSTQDYLSSLVHPITIEVDRDSNMTVESNGDEAVAFQDEKKSEQEPEASVSSPPENENEDNQGDKNTDDAKEDSKEEEKQPQKTKTVDWPLRDIKEPHANDVLYGRGGEFHVKFSPDTRK